MAVIPVYLFRDKIIFIRKTAKFDIFCRVVDLDPDSGFIADSNQDPGFGIWIPDSVSRSRIRIQGQENEVKAEPGLYSKFFSILMSIVDPDPN
jgi:hypothetical protein